MFALDDETEEPRHDQVEESRVERWRDGEKEGKARYNQSRNEDANADAKMGNGASAYCRESIL
ncbi:hypothetical protein BCON_0025g00380 [Botryotinia convoluta]|uniref:Uncharacterized protein n=1 Tax=Botryotinia convoluta TaxID=54673 RepID=A0A4Z1IJE7_9HELO|nr:hypothetical protein BCON_0025g00380 [Botryotinia convoluta]